MTDFSERTALRDSPEFRASFNKIRHYLTNGFAYSANQGKLIYSIPNPKNPEKKSRAVYHLLVPYLPYALFSLWGGVLGQAVMFPLWESRIQQDILYSKTYRTLSKMIPDEKQDSIASSTEIGSIDVRYTKKLKVDDKTITVIDFTPNFGLNAPAPLNNYLKVQSSGIGFSIFRSPIAGSIILTKSENIPSTLWECVCNKLIELEGISDEIGSSGAWHVTRSSNGIAPFLLGYVTTNS